MKCGMNDLNQEYCNFYAQKIVESYLLFGDKIIELIIDDPIVKKAIYKAQASCIIVGHKNQIKYYVGLVYIRMRLLLISIMRKLMSVN